MLETGDFVVDQLPGPAALQEAGGHPLAAGRQRRPCSPAAEARQIWAYRLPSLLGAMLAAAACAWGAAAFFGPRAALLAGAMLGATLPAVHRGLHRQDRRACWAAHHPGAGGAAPALRRGARRRAGGRRWRAALFWIGQAPGHPGQGADRADGRRAHPAGAVALRTGDAGWICKASAGPGAWSWSWPAGRALGRRDHASPPTAASGRARLGGDLAPSWPAARRRHGAPPGYHLLLAPILLFPIGPAAAGRRWSPAGGGAPSPACASPSAWLIPTWLLFEALPTKLVHYPLPMYRRAGLAGGGGAGRADGRRCRWPGRRSAAVAGVALAGRRLLPDVGVWRPVGRHGRGPVAGGAAGRRRPDRRLHDRAQGAPRGRCSAPWRWASSATPRSSAGLAPRLDPLWLSDRAERAMARARLPAPAGRGRRARWRWPAMPSPAWSSRWAPPPSSNGPDEAARAIAEGRPAVVEAPRGSRPSAARRSARRAGRPGGRDRAAWTIPTATR